MTTYKKQGQYRKPTDSGSFQQRRATVQTSRKEVAGSSESTPQNQFIYCKTHHRPYCAECCVSESAVQHACNAFAGPEVELKCGCTVPVLAEACDMAKELKARMPVSVGKLFGQDVEVSDG